MDINKKVSHLIANQFPAYYQENGSIMVDFLEAYYEFLENTYGYSEYMNRILPETNDIDQTLDEFVVHFKNKYLSEFPLVTYTDQRTMVKHIMDFYRSKGSEKSVKLLMKMIFGEEAQVYYPAKDILRASASVWKIPRYIEVTTEDRNFEMVGKNIIGTISKATASVDAIVRKRTNGTFVDVMYLSNLSNEFQINDVITDDGNLNGAPKVLGSLNSIVITEGALNYSVGDEVKITGTYGDYAAAIVKKVENPSDKVTYTLIDGGFGYTTNSLTSVLISEKKIRLSTLPSLRTLDNLYQYKFTAGTTNSTIENYIGEEVSLYDGGVFKFIGVVLDATNSANVTVGIESWTSLSNYQSTLSGIDNITYVSSTGTITINLSSTPSDETVFAYTINTKGFGLGIKFTDTNTEQLLVSGGNIPKAHIQNETGDSYEFTYIEGGSGFGFDIATIEDEQNVSVNTNTIEDGLGSVTNWQTTPVSGILSSTLNSLLTYTNTSIGRISRLDNFTPGSGYESDPFVAVINKSIESLGIGDKYLTVEFPSVGAFLTNGDEMRVGSTLIGYVRDYDISGTSGQVEIRTVTLNTNVVSLGDTVSFRQYGSSTDYISATVTNVETLYQNPVMGINASIDTDVFGATGTITELKIKNSGFGYRDGDLVSFRSDENNILGSGVAVAVKTGTGTGYWETTSSHLNSTKKLRDNDYYQEYSYEIQSGINLTDYERVVKNTVHVAGTKLFGRVINTSVSALDLKSNSDSKIVTS